MTRSPVLVITLGCVALSSSACRAAPSSRLDEIIGEYSSVTESSCNLTITLRAQEKATLSQSCRAEDGSHQDLKSETAAAWSSTGADIVVTYEGGSDSLRFDPALPYNFGRAGAGPGLVVKGAPSRESQLAGYDQMWKRMIPAER